MNVITEILELYYKLSIAEQSELRIKLSNDSYGDEISAPVQSCCPHCTSSRIIHYGSVKGSKRYKCNDCKRSFGNYSHTIYSGIKKKDKFLLFKNIMLTEGAIPLRTMCKRVGISVQTSFDWRHKLIVSLYDSDSKLTNEVQIDDIWVSYSQKGRKGLKYSKKRGGNKKAGDNNYQVKVLIATNKDTTIMKVARIGRLTKSDIDDSIGHRIEKETKLISDSHPSIIGFAKDHNIKHVHFKSKKHLAETGENVQFLNSQASRLNTMINGVFKGVATKYLQNYANWNSFIETNKFKDVNKVATMTILKDKNGWMKFINTERCYKTFLERYSVRTYRCPVLRGWKSNNWNEINFAS